VAAGRRAVDTAAWWKDGRRKGVRRRRKKKERIQTVEAVRDSGIKETQTPPEVSVTRSVSDRSV